MYVFILFCTLAATNFSAFFFLGFSGTSYRAGWGFYGIMAMGTSLVGLSILLLGIPIHKLGTTTFRLPYTPVAFGALASGLDIGMEMGGAIALAIGMGMQNAPEGFAVSMPLRREGFSKFKSWWWGQLSAIVEPIFAVIGAAVVISVYPILPYALAFAAGAMIFIVVENVVPESHRGGNVDIASIGLILGFIVMMILDVSLG